MVRHRPTQCFTLSPELVEELNKASKETNIPKSRLVELSLKKFLEVIKIRYSVE